MPAEEARLFRLADEKALRWKVIQVTDWSPLRCDPSQPRDMFWMARLFDATDGEEIARATIAASGLVNIVRFNSPTAPRLGEPLSFSAELPQTLGASPDSSQYVYLYTTLQCSSIDPCVAWRSPKGILVQAHDALVLVPSGQSPLRFDVELAGKARSAEYSKVRSRGDHIVSLGGNLAGAGRVVGPGIPWAH